MSLDGPINRLTQQPPPMIIGEQRHPSVAGERQFVNVPRFVVRLDQLAMWPDSRHGCRPVWSHSQNGKVRTRSGTAGQVTVGQAPPDLIRNPCHSIFGGFSVLDAGCVRDSLTYAGLVRSADRDPQKQCSPGSSDACLIQLATSSSSSWSCSWMWK